MKSSSVGDCTFVACKYIHKGECEMINLLGLDFSIVAFLGILFAFAFTCIAIAKLEKLGVALGCLLPKSID